ncbi:MAG: colicin E3/pyocin S6 family cytotoxin [Gammaproteobacteria bacterium]
MSGYVANNRHVRKEPLASPYNGDFDNQPPRPLELNVSEPKQPTQPPSHAGCVFAKPCTLPDGQIDYPRTAPAELISTYGKTSVLAASSANAAGDFPLSRLSGESVAGLTALSLRGLAVAGSTGGAISGTSAAGGAAAVTGGVVAGALVGVVALFWPSSMGNSDLYTAEQLRNMTSARTRVRFRIEQTADGTIKAYGFHTAAKTGWEMIDVVQFETQGSEQVADFGDGITLIWTPSVDPAAAKGIPPLKAGPQVPPIWIYPATDTAAKALENPIYPPEYKDFILVFPADSGIQPLYVVMSVPGLGYQPAPAALPGFPDAVKAKKKTSVQGGGKLRPRWRDSDGNIYEWDFQHGAVEKYNKRGKHLGEFNHITGEQTKSPDNARKVEP